MTRLKSACDDDDDLVHCFLSTDECERVNLTKAVYYAPDSGVQVASWQFTNHHYFPDNAVSEHMLESYPKCIEPLFSARLISRAGYGTEAEEGPQNEHFLERVLNLVKLTASTA